MKLFLRSLIVFLFLIFSSAFFPQTVFAETTLFRSANIVTTDISGTFYSNLENCSVTDGQTCDRATATSFGNLYFKDFGNYEDFGIPEGSTITKVRIKVTGKASIPVFALFVGLGTNCQTPSDLWTLWQLNGNTINTQTFVTNVTQTGVPSAVKASCLSPISFENKSFIFRINYSSNLPWSANIDNFEVAFDYNPPAVTPTPTPTPAKTPLILIPGIAGSELKVVEDIYWLDKDDGHDGEFNYIYPKDETVWLNEDKAGALGEDDYFDVLRMKKNGVDSEIDIELTGGVVSLVYQKTIDFFISNGYVLNEDFFVFPYDWRKDISLTASLLDQKINEIKTQTGSDRVDVVAHSMGGLVARNYISDPAKAQNVRKLFTLGTPHLGSVDSLKALRYGNCLTRPELKNSPICFGVIFSEVKDVIQNMISGYELAPSQSYFNFYSGEDNNHPYPYKTESGALNYVQIKTLLTDFGHNTSLFNPSEAFHVIDTNLSNTNDVDITVIAGSGRLTLGQIIEEKRTSLLGVQYIHKDILNINGDETVPLFSASLNDSSKNVSLLGLANVYYTKQEHGELVASGSALNLVRNILEGNNQLPENVSEHPYSLMNWLFFSSHSPVKIHVYDSFGNHTGPTVNGDFETNIPDSLYSTLDDAKFISVPEDGIYTIKFEATDQGSFDFKIRKYENDENTQTILYKDIPLTENTKAETTFNSSEEPPILLVDEDGNETTDFEVSSSSVLAGHVVFDQIPPQTLMELSGVEGLNGWYKSDVIVALIPQDEENGSGILKTEYVLDGEEAINVYTEPFAISAEKINKLKFKSIDNAGNEEDPKEVEIGIDKTNPNILASVEDEVYLLNQNIQVDYSCSDDISGLESCIGLQEDGTNLDTSSVGVKSFTINSSDKAGNNLSQAFSYKIQYANSGICLNNLGHVILQPINSDGTSIFKQGSTIPAKFRVCDINGLSISASDLIKNFNLVKIISGTAVSNINESVNSITPESNFRWDLLSQQWIFNMSTKNLSAGKTYLYRIELNDLTNMEFSFGLR